MTGSNMLLTKEHNVARIVIKQAIIGTHVLSYMDKRKRYARSIRGLAAEVGPEKGAPV